MAVDAVKDVVDSAGAGSIRAEAEVDQGSAVGVASTAVTLDLARMAPAVGSLLGAAVGSLHAEEVRSMEVVAEAVVPRRGILSQDPPLR
jgi:hypothetical protein